MNWTLFDFVFAGILLATLGLAVVLLLRLKRSRAYRAGLFLFIVTSVFLIIANGAVGVIGGSHNDANMLYFTALGAAWLGGLLMRFRSSWLSRFLSVLALAHVFIAASAVILRWGQAGAAWPWDILIASAVFAVLWQVSAWLFGLDAEIRRLKGVQI
ncbi:hypothetical protein D1224_00195 [Henriciella barbarensis]|uniref:DUF2306 domain-containing protein n=1 Tax=Henriciella barbarensis TaxID=86342 RepID=A0A399R6P9_9PROT|nr:hypothetical protein [Henriciella barbarensis]RIJ26334.1 hypothetical protein D1224_00195 [Henriciella barbarensis]